MGKDPAFLFYSSDFLTGTMFMTDEQVGKYIRLLCSQHQHGHMTERDMLKICKTYDEDIFEKFDKDSDGKYYQHRLELEVNKRIAYSDSRRKNRTVKDKDMSNTSKSYDEHMENENRNENIDDNGVENTKNIKGKKKANVFSEPTLDEVKEYCKERQNGIDPERFIAYYQSNGWMIGKNKMKDWQAAVRTWEKNSGQYGGAPALPLEQMGKPDALQGYKGRS